MAFAGNSRHTIAIETALGQPRPTIFQVSRATEKTNKPGATEFFACAETSFTFSRSIRRMRIPAARLGTSLNNCHEPSLNPRDRNWDNRVKELLDDGSSPRPFVARQTDLKYQIRATAAAEGDAQFLRSLTCPWARPYDRHGPPQHDLHRSSEPRGTALQLTWARVSRSFCPRLKLTSHHDPPLTPIPSAEI